MRDLTDLIERVKQDPTSEEAWTVLIDAADEANKYIIVPDMGWDDMRVRSWEDDVPVPRVIGHNFIPRSQWIPSDLEGIEAALEGRYVGPTKRRYPPIVSSMTTIAAKNIRIVDEFTTNPICGDCGKRRNPMTPDGWVDAYAEISTPDGIPVWRWTLDQLEDVIAPEINTTSELRELLDNAIDIAVSSGIGDPGDKLKIVIGNNIEEIEL